MTDENEREPRNRRGRQDKPPSVHMSHGPVLRARDDTFSTTIFVSIEGWFEGGDPKVAELYLGEAESFEIDFHERRASLPLTGLKPESHHVIAAVVHEHRRELLLVVPALPKPKRPEEETLERERIGLERARVRKDREDLEKSATTKKLPAKFVVDPYRVGNDVSLLIRVGNREGTGVANAKLTVRDSVKGIQTLHCDEDGEYEYNFTLQTNEEREISICVAGYGTKAFRRTFRGRN
ncbi:MAG: hypothetical protein HY378_01585 [Candidatus Brennerbacteria bacterium]|nr:hypothetical protein [Candidatus Brennerbacteria bacterium]